MWSNSPVCIGQILGINMYKFICVLQVDFVARYFRSSNSCSLITTQSSIGQSLIAFNRCAFKLSTATHLKYVSSLNNHRYKPYKSACTEFFLYQSAKNNDVLVFYASMKFMVFGEISLGPFYVQTCFSCSEACKAAVQEPLVDRSNLFCYNRINLFD